MERRVHYFAEESNASASGATREQCAALGGGFNAHSPELGYKQPVPLNEAIRRTIY
jgi:hypothetical protein